MFYKYTAAVVVSLLFLSIFSLPAFAESYVKSIYVSPSQPSVHDTAVCNVTLCIKPTALSAWHADGNANDEMGRNNGILQSGAGFAAGKIGQAFSFDGRDSVVLIPDSSNLNFQTAMTMEAWVYSTGKTYDNAQIIGQYHNLLTIGDANRFRAHITVPRGRAVIDGNTKVESNRWYHVAMVYDGSYLKLYVNGVFDGQIPATGSIAQTTEPVKIGNGIPGSSYSFRGVIDEVKIYNVALTEDDIRNSYQNGGLQEKCGSPTQGTAEINWYVSGKKAATSDTLNLNMLLGGETIACSTTPITPFGRGEEKFSGNVVVSIPPIPRIIIQEEYLNLRDWLSPYSFFTDSIDKYWKPVNGAWEVSRSIFQISGGRIAGEVNTNPISEKVTADNLFQNPSHIYYRVLVKPDGSEEVIDEYFFNGNNPTSSYSEYPSGFCSPITTSSIAPGEEHTKTAGATCPITHYYNNRYIPFKSIDIKTAGKYKVELRHIKISGATQYKYGNRVFSYRDTVDTYSAEPRLLGSYEEMCSGSCRYMGTMPITRDPSIYCEGPIWTEETFVRTGWNDYVNSRIGSNYKLTEYCYSISLQGRNVPLSAISETEKVREINIFPPVNSVYIEPDEALLGDNLECKVDSTGQTEISWYVNGAKVATAETLPSGMFKGGDKITCSAIPILGSRAGFEVFSKEVVIQNSTVPVAFPFAFSSGEGSENTGSPQDYTPLAAGFGLFAAAATGTYFALRSAPKQRKPPSKGSPQVIVSVIKNQIKDYTRNLAAEMRDLITYADSKTAEAKRSIDSYLDSRKAEAEERRRAEYSDGGGIPLFKGKDGYYRMQAVYDEQTGKTEYTPKYWGSAPGAHNPWAHPDSIPPINGMGWTFSSGKIVGRDQPALDELARLNDKAKNSGLSEQDETQLENLKSDPYLNSDIKKNISENLAQIRADRQASNDASALINAYTNNSPEKDVVKKMVDLYYSLQSIYNRPSLSSETRERIKGTMQDLLGQMSEVDGEFAAAQRRYTNPPRGYAFPNPHRGYPIRIRNSDYGVITNQQVALEWKQELNNVQDAYLTEQERLERERQGFLGGLWHSFYNGGQFLIDLTRDAMILSVLPMWISYDLATGSSGASQWINQKVNSVGNFLYTGGQVLLNVTRAAIVFTTPVGIIWYLADKPGFMQYYNDTASFVSGAATAVLDYCTGSAYGAGECTGEVIQLLAPAPPILELARVGKVGEAARLANAAGRGAEILVPIKNVGFSVYENGAKRVVRPGDAFMTAYRQADGSYNLIKTDMDTLRRGHLTNKAGRLFEVEAAEALQQRGFVLDSGYPKGRIDGRGTYKGKRYILEMKRTLSENEFPKYGNQIDNMKRFDSLSKIAFVTSMKSIPKNIANWFRKRGTEIINLRPKEMETTKGLLEGSSLNLKNRVLQMRRVEWEGNNLLHMDPKDADIHHLSQIVGDIQEGAEKYGTKLDGVYYYPELESMAASSYSTLVLDSRIPAARLLEAEEIPHEFGHMWVAQKRFENAEEYSDFLRKYRAETWLMELEADASIRRFIGPERFRNRVAHVIGEAESYVEFMLGKKKNFSPRDIEMAISTAVLSVRTGDNKLMARANSIVNILIDRGIISENAAKTVAMELDNWLRNTIDKGRVGDAYFDVGEMIRYGEHSSVENTVKILSLSNKPKQFWWMQPVKKAPTSQPSTSNGFLTELRYMVNRMLGN